MTAFFISYFCKVVIFFFNLLGLLILSLYLSIYQMFVNFCVMFQFLYYVCLTNIIYKLKNISLKLTNTIIWQNCLKKKKDNF